MTAPFGATLAGVRDLVVDVAAEGRRPAGGGLPVERIGEDRIRSWLEEGGGRVARRIIGWEQLRPSELRAQLENTARGLTELYAAAWLWDATHPERAKDDSRYGAVLYDRFREGLTELEADVTRLRDQEATALLATDTAGPGADANFPPPGIGRRTGL